jgi:hypothetical protein
MKTGTAESAETSKAGRLAAQTSPVGIIGAKRLPAHQSDFTLYYPTGEPLEHLVRLRSAFDLMHVWQCLSH